MEEEYVYQGRMAVCGPRKVGDGQFNQHAIGAVLIAHSGQPLISDSGDWENIQCEIIIRPIKKLGKSKVKGMRVDQATLYLSQDENWTKESEE